MGDPNDDELMKAANAAIRHLNSSRELQNLAMGWNRRIVFKFQPAINLRDLIVTLAGDHVECQRVLSEGARGLTVLITPRAFLRFCEGRMIAKKAIVAGELKLLNYSMIDVLKLEALLNMLRMEPSGRS